MQAKFLTNGRKGGEKRKNPLVFPHKRETGNRTHSFCRLPFEVIRFDSIRLQLALESFFESQANDFCGLFFGHIFCPFCARLPSLSFAFSSLSPCAFVPGDLGCAEFVYGLELLWPHCD